MGVTLLVEPLENILDHFDQRMQLEKGRYFSVRFQTLAVSLLELQDKVVDDLNEFQRTDVHGVLRSSAAVKMVQQKTHQGSQLGNELVGCVYIACHSIEKFA